MLLWDASLNNPDFPGNPVQSNDHVIVVSPGVLYPTKLLSIAAADSQRIVSELLKQMGPEIYLGNSYMFKDGQTLQQYPLDLVATAKVLHLTMNMHKNMDTFKMTSNILKGAQSLQVSMEVDSLQEMLEIHDSYKKELDEKD